MASFKVIKDVVADQIVATNNLSPEMSFDLEFTGPFTTTVRATATNRGNEWSLHVPRFIGTDDIGTVNSFVAHLPSWLPTPANAALGIPVYNDDEITTGYIQVIASEGKVVLIVPTPRVNYANGCGLPNDALITYRV